MYVVTGVTGNTGAAVADSLLERGVPVRVVVRDRSKATNWAERGAEVVVADLVDASSLVQAFEGAQAAYVLNPPAYHAEDMFAQAGRIGDALLQAVRKSGLTKVVLLSAIGAHIPEGTGNIITNFMLEQSLRKLAIPVTFVRAAWFMENWASVLPPAANDGVLPSFVAPLDGAFPMVAAKDIGRVSADAMLDERGGMRVIEIEGPEKYSPNDVADACAKILNRRVQAVALPEAEWPDILAAAQFSGRTITAWIEMLSAFNKGVIVSEGKGVDKIKGTTSIEEAVANLIRKMRTS